MLLVVAAASAAINGTTPGSNRWVVCLLLIVSAFTALRFKRK